MRRLFIALLLLIPQDDTLKVKVSLVTVGVRVTDSRGRSVTGLKAEDFSILDEGISQKIEFFSNEEQPITLGVILDRSFSMSYNAKLERAREAASVLVDGAHKGSEYFYIAFDDQVRLIQDFTTDPTKVQSAINQTKLGQGTSLHDAIIQGLTLSTKAQLPRQALVVISDGADQHSQRELQETMRIVRESETQIFTIGYFSSDEDKLFRRSGPRVGLSDGRLIDNPRNVLERVARESGAESYFPRADAELVKAVRQITEDLRSQYTLAFYPQPEDRENRYHQLRVNIRGGRYSVRARPGYGTPESQPAVMRRTDTSFAANVERRNGRTFYRDDFIDPSSGWPDRVSAKYSSEGYQLSGDDIVAVNGPAFRNFRASVSMKAGRGGGGLVFRQSDGGYYALAVLGGDAVVRRIETIKTTELGRWPVTASRSSPRKIEVRCEGNDCSFYYDEMLMGSIRDGMFTEGRVGLYLSGRGDLVFRELVVEETR